MTSKNYTTFTLTFSSSEPLGLQVHKFSETCMAQNATAQSLETQIVVTKIFKGQQGEQVGGLEINDLVTHVSNKKFKGDVDAFISLIGRQRKKKRFDAGSRERLQHKNISVWPCRIKQNDDYFGVHHGGVIKFSPVWIGDLINEISITIFHLDVIF